MTPTSSRGKAGRVGLVVSRVFDKNIRGRGWNYVLQCGLATVSLVVILLVEDALLRAAIVVAVASTAFTIFVVPDSVAATPRKVVGGHAVAVAAGSLFSAILLIPAVDSASEDSRYIFDVLAAMSVGLGILVMVATDTEHPPAAGTALGLVISWSLSAVLFIMVSALVLSAVRLALRKKMVNLI